ncbi:MULTISPECIES: AlpA family transcriptional regulator [unclassified Pseudomonas]|uniref:helix-turn-helix transcriptional regulator n=1 Tax=unclassified Pseudomonas TaxID=196821 RepID=UPI000C87D386|nr:MULTISPECIES: AlpA family phage regulatory protein [unclassified Pseudomonas]PMU11719.1 AlpA family transcriptional regulator [Pseudomonas sp. FW305-20]PMU15393.1 AlpA family transcriptional regulator [Pseudomonas sp. FW305-122]PMU43236.1 AlpA family transcriptional regulator [Pseudomonas sp. FW305-47B]PMX63527.1 AlpA family transcriptional regulator [Pseudomonas sp. FW305-60]PMX64561.1 AlpA family transcriptional regulator [Pseudomonas sp. FW305-33]
MKELDRFVPTSEVLQITSFSRATLWREVKAGRFPKSVRISVGRVAWRASELATWQEAPGRWQK